LLVVLVLVVFGPAGVITVKLRNYDGRVSGENTFCTGQDSHLSIDEVQSGASRTREGFISLLVVGLLFIVEPKLDLRFGDR
jgi:acetylornithine/succinyldiaminopimelate/putrescine aminotransferase